MACTSLSYTDTTGRVYFGRTMELTGDLPWQVVYFPRGQKFESDVGDGHPPLVYTSRYGMLAITMPNVTPGEKPTLGDLKIVEGQNEAGLTFSILAYPTAAGPQAQYEMTQALLNATDLGTWTLGQFATVADVKEALAKQPLVLAPVKALKGAEPPMHFVLHDRTGASIVIEFENGQQTIYGNPVGVMTNGPQFSWHLTNLRNYAHLTNVDRMEGRFGNLKVTQFDAGIANTGLPSDDTSVGRFVRAAYYSTFAEKVDDPDRAIHTLAQVMNNFDRPRGITVSEAGEGDALTKGLGLVGDKHATEYTLWTILGDLERGLFFVRSYLALNYTMFDIKQLAKHDTPMVVPLTAFDGMAGDSTQRLVKAGKR